jgi:hypothetical protein
MYVLVKFDKHSIIVNDLAKLQLDEQDKKKKIKKSKDPLTKRY